MALIGLEPAGDIFCSLLEAKVRIAAALPRLLLLCRLSMSVSMECPRWPLMAPWPLVARPLVEAASLSRRQIRDSHWGENTADAVLLLLNSLL